MGRKSPRDYIRLACELHLDAHVSPGDAESQKAVDAFLQEGSGSGGEEGGSNSPSLRLFVWVPQAAGDDAHAVASTECMPKDGRHRSAVVFLHTADSSASKDSHQIQCMTIQPTAPSASSGEGGDEAAAQESKEAEEAMSSQQTLLQTFQLYTRQCFLPSVQVMMADQDKNQTTMLQDKIRELDVALSQSQRSARLPHVDLKVHPLLEQAAAKKTSDKIDWDQLGLASKFGDDDFLNQVQTGVSQWITQIRQITVLPKTTSFPLIEDSDKVQSADLEEVAFWGHLEDELQSIQGQLERPDVQLTLALLREAKRFVATRALENDTGLEQAIGYTSDVAHFIKPYPVAALQAARDFDKITAGVNAIFDHLVKVRSSRYYSLERCLKLLEATTLTLRRCLVGVLQDQYQNLLFMEYKEYENKIRYPTQDVFVQFDDRLDEFKDFFLEQGRRRKMPTPGKVWDKMVLHHNSLKERLDQIHEFRSGHNQLKEVVTKVLQDDEETYKDAIGQVEGPIRKIFNTVDVLDLSSGGNKAVQSALEEYDLQMDAMEEKLAKLLRDKLTACKDAESMFRVFARFSLLLTRTRVRAAVKEFQIQLISTVAEAVEKLQSKFTHKYEASSSAHISRLRGIPPIAGKILWAKQLERQVYLLMERMGNVLGPNWGQQLEGRQLRKSGDELLAKLDARSFFRNWVMEWEKEITAAATSPLHAYPVMIQTDGRNENLVATVNFDEKTELLFTEIKYLKWLGFGSDIPRTLAMVSQESMERYPYAVTIKTALRSYQAVRVLITPELEPLVMPQLIEIRETIAEAFGVKLSGSTSAKKRRIRWDSKEISQWVGTLAESVSKFEERVEELLNACGQIDNALESLEAIEYDAGKFRSVLETVQKTIDAMSLSGYSDLASWVKVVSKRIGSVLAKRLQSAITSWNITYKKAEKGDGDADDTSGAQTEKAAAVKPVVEVAVPSKLVVVDIILRNQEISAAPSVPGVRSVFLDKFHDFLGVICDLQKPKSGRFEVFESTTPSAAGVPTEDESFDYLIQMVPPGILAEAYGIIESHVLDVAAFANQWLAYQTLWDTQVTDVASSVGNDVEKWHALLLEASESRATLDSSGNQAEFGPVVVKYGKVQSQINLKYDSWQKELQASFAAILAQLMSELHEKISSAKTKLEKISLETSGSSTDDIVLGVTFIQEMKQRLDPLQKEIGKLEESEKLLKRQRYIFRHDWLESSVVKGKYDSMVQILNRRTQAMEEQIPLLQSRITAEDKNAAKQRAELLSSWEQDKPLRGSATPPAAMEVLSKFEYTMKKASTHQENLIKAKDALGLEHTAETTALSECIDELQDLKEVWQAVMKPYEELQKVKDTPWSTAVMRKVKRGLDDLLAEMRSLPNRIRQYDAYVHLHDSVKGYIGGHGLLSDLKTEALKERHWKTILQRLGVHLQFTDITVGTLWDNGIINRKKEMLEILTVAQGEMALEVFLGEVRDRWTNQELELVLFQNRVRLIRGWDDLFATLDDHIGGLALMKSSPYYRAVREFQEEGKLWEDRLTKLRAAFDAWVDVQRRWVYLEGILFGSSDIKAQLPAEWSRFKSVDSEFVQLMRRIASKPYAMEVLSIQNLQRTLERIGNLMGVIQRALGDYLERQRSDFSRFYFLGDDDLLEIIGNSGEPGKVLTHVGKMFAGLHSARIDTTSELPEGVSHRLDAMVSKDGEVVPFSKPIDITKGMSVNDWLKELENQMKSTLANLLEQAVNEDKSSEGQSSGEEGEAAFVTWATKFPAQVMILAAQIYWSDTVSKALSDSDSNKALEGVLNGLEWRLEVMAKTVLQELPPDSRKKFEQLITELVRQRDVVRSLMEEKVDSPTAFAWQYHLRYTYNPKAADMNDKLIVSLSNARFSYGFEYLGIGERLVQTPLTDKCYLTLTQALHFRMGGSPFGPAGTGKTETVKALGAQLGRFVLVFNCDETFDFSAMGRIFAGLTQVGAWGCFDEFNRLEERILSAVSQQILTIQRGLIERQENIEMLGRACRLHENVAVFITMNPGYAGRSNLPDNLKSLFRSFAMVVPDRNLIAQVMLYSQGIVSAEKLSGKIVDLFMACQKKMSQQKHYDFGLRALKTLLVSAGALKRQAIEGKADLEGEELELAEKNALIVGACNNVLPKLVAEDMAVFTEVLEEIFPGSTVAKMEDEKVQKELIAICEERNLVPSENFSLKVNQLKMVIEMRHGIMIVGPVGSGKSAALNVLMKAMEKVDGMKGDMYIIDPKAINKDSLYGTLDGTTLEWTDGVFTSLLRAIIDNQKGESERRHWIVFDGDVDPEWAENLNSVLDDNKLLTLPSGERLSIPSNVRIILEVDSLENATPASVSRCGMVWFSEDTVSSEMVLEHLMGSLRKANLLGDGAAGEEIPPAQTLFLDSIKPLMLSDRTSSLVIDALEFALAEDHVMVPTRDRLFHTFKATLVQGINMAIAYDENHPDFPMSGEHMEKFAKRWLLHALMWSFCGSASWEVRKKFSDMLVRTSGVFIPSSDHALFDYRVRVEDGELELWSSSVPRMEIESHRVSSSDVVITTTDTLRHSDLLGAWLSSRTPLILCGPPGSGKTMTLTNVLQSVEGVVLASLNFSSRTTPEIILKVFAQYCNYVRRGKDIVLEPAESLGSQAWLVVFCDEINLPEEDAYGTQRVIMFMRQLVEQGGFWRSDNVWVKINRIQFVGACNPPTDSGRFPMSNRWLRHCQMLLVDFPERDSLMQIYRTFNGGMMKMFPNLKGETDALTSAMVEVYTENQKRFTTDIQPQYFYSPRELSRWVRGIYEAIVHMDQGLTGEELVRVWAHEGLRLFADRLVDEEDRKWCNEKLDEVARKHFAHVDFDAALARPLFYTNWVSKDTRRIERNELKEFLTARLRVFYEEELDVPLVVFDEVLEHVLRIDRVLRQPMGHVLLAGDSGAGKTVLSKFVSWMNGLSIFQIKAHSRYGMDDFCEDLRSVMRRVGVEGEKICFIFDEANVLSAGFLESMNALLASGEVPGLFEGEDFTSLMSACRDSAARDGVILDTEEEIFRRFTSIVQRDLHVVFTVNPSGGDWKNRSTTSPALFNRCVIDWFGTWSDKALAEVGKEFTLRLDLGDTEAVGGAWGIGDGEPLMQRVEDVFEGANRGGLRQAVVAALVDLHRITKETAEEVGTAASSITRTFMSPRDYLALIQNFVTCLNNRREVTESNQLHINSGLSKLQETQENVAELKKGLGATTAELKKKEALANEKLQQMVADQNEAERSKAEAEKVSKEVEEQQKEIDKRKDEAQRDLDEAEPALKEAQQSVRGIKKRDLDEVRNLARPPNNVKLTLECVAIMLGETKIEWADVRKILAKTDFIPSILNFDADKLSAKRIKTVKEKYLDGNPDLTAESVMRSSKACGPLFKWAESQIKYSSVYNRVQPLREEVEQLEQAAASVKGEKERLDAEVARLEDSIGQYKADYALLIRDVEALKTEMETVKTKVERAESLLKSLGHESERWSKSSEGFQSMLRGLIGDALLMASFLTYSGFFDFKTRSVLMNKWKNSLDLLGIEHRPDLGLVESLSAASDRLIWQSQGLPSDQLSLENGVILEHCIRFPLIIDPSGSAIDFLMEKHKDERIQKTSFVDKAFMKTLAGAVRFGTTLLVENVEKIDPVLNPILNREHQRTGGRTLVRIGTEDVDYSPKFRIILSTKNPAVQLTPDLCSRVTLLNFTVTPDSLQSQSLSQVIKSEKPDLEAQRASLLKLQGEQNVKLRELEDKMLNTISACKGSILDDDRVVEGMEVLMKEGAQVEEQISHSAEIMDQVHKAVAEFEPFAMICRKLFVLLEAMREISFLYEFTATTFMTILQDILTKNAQAGAASAAERTEMLKKALFQEVVARISRGLQVDDKMVFSLLLARLYSGNDSIGSKEAKSTDDHIAAFSEVFGNEFPWQGRALNDLAEVTEQEISATVPLLLCSAPGHDVSGRVEAMARELGKELKGVAMGSSEGFGVADSLVTSASKRGTWVMLKNAHLCTDWLRESFVKSLHSLGAGTHPDFRLFITSEINPRLPTALLRISDTIIAEAPTGIKASISRFFSGISKDRFGMPVRNRLYLVLAWTHAVIQERLRYVPSGWSERYEFTEADAVHALDVIDALIEEETGGKQTMLDPEKLPWDAIRSTLCRGVFGGRVTASSDQEVMDKLVNSLFVKECFNLDFKLVPTISNGPTLPENTSKENCFEWIASLPSHASPEWCGLTADAEFERDERLAKTVAEKVDIVFAKMM